jgi:hypothetical protein
VWSQALVVDPDTGEASVADVREHTAGLGGAGTLGSVSSFGVGVAARVVSVVHPDP